MRFAHPELLVWLESGAAVVTSTPLLAAVCQKQYVDHQLTAGRKTWSPPAILSLNAWLQQLWRDARFRLEEDAPVLLSRSQEQVLWQEAIEKSRVAVLGLDATARDAMEAYRFIADWQLPLDEYLWEEEDARQFYSWLKQIHVRCSEAGWFLNADLPQRLAASAARLALPSQMVFAGFEEPARALQHLVHFLEASGVKIAFATARNEAAGLFSLACNDFEDELDAAARWARARLAEQPNVSIGILVQNLAQNRAVVRKCFNRILRPVSAFDAASSHLDSADSAFHIHSDASLMDQPVIAAAFSLFDFAFPSIPSSSVSAVLRSPFFRGAADERNQRALADAQLRRLREVELSFDTVKNSSSQCPKLTGIWTKLSDILRRLPRQKAEPSQWSRTFRQLLEAAGWPGDLTLSPLEEEAVRQWRETLSAFEALTLVTAPVSHRNALLHLRSLASANGPSSGDLSSPIQVLEPRAAGSLRFDLAWLVGASELEWPPLTFTPAYVPLSLQRSKGVPSSTAAGRWEQARRLTDQIGRSAETLVTSFSAPDASEASLSSCFAGSTVVTRHDLQIWDRKTVLEQLEICQLVKIDDTQGPPVTAPIAVQGGTHLLKSQAACPFQAFARWRLNAEQVEEGAFSFDARDRGEFLHRAMAGVWKRLKDSERLRSLKDLHLHAIVSEAVEEALSSDRVDTTFRVQLRKAETRRLIAVILAWLEREKQRAGSFEPLELESQADFQLSKLALRLRADRIDQLPGGGLVVIDYKSGKADRSNLDGDRPKEPQLLVYAALLGSKVEGVYFASLRRGECGASGYGSKAHFGESKETVGRSWSEQLRIWSSTVTKLAEEFETGRAPVDPLPGVCDFCGIKPICRIEESRREKPQEAE